MYNTQLYLDTLADGLGDLDDSSFMAHLHDVFVEYLPMPSFDIPDLINCYNNYLREFPLVELTDDDYALLADAEFAVGITLYEWETDNPIH